MRFKPLIASLMALLLMPALASAHVGSMASIATDTSWMNLFLQGLIHPLTGLDHLLAMISVGVWSAQTTRRVWLAPLLFAVMLLIGALLGMSGVSSPIAEPVVAASVVVLGWLVAMRVKFPVALGLGLVGVFALCHGLAHGAEFGSAGGFAGAALLMGMLFSTIGLHLAGLAVGHTLKDRQKITRAMGALIALMGGGLILQLI